MPLLDNMSLHAATRVNHTARAPRLLYDMSTPQEALSHPFIDKSGKQVVKVEKIFPHRRRKRAFQILKQIQNLLLDEAEWKPLWDFVDADETITEEVDTYIKELGILPEQHLFSALI